MRTSDKIEVFAYSEREDAELVALETWQMLPMWR